MGMMPITVHELSAEERGRLLNDLLLMVNANVDQERIKQEYRSVVPTPVREPSPVLVPEPWFND